MAAPKAKTLQQRFGFMDKELSTPQHDNIMIWLDGYVNNEMFKPEKIKIGRYIDDTFAEQAREELEHFVRSEGNCKMPEIWPDSFSVPNIKAEWEKPITSGRNKYIIGFVDMVVSFWQTDRYALVKKNDVYENSTWSYQAEWDSINSHSTCAFEVKPSIRSVGEVLRQINMYKINFGARYYIVCPDDRFKSILESQDVGFIKCPSFKQDAFDEAMR